jgi:glycine C-acetyltransferase/8-amino-7-oxononanoate synthase
VDRLQANADGLRRALDAEGFDSGGSTTQVVPLVVGGAADAMRMCEEAIDRGVFAQAVRPPTVPEGTSRLRLAVMASHTRAELQSAARVLAESARAAGLDPRDAPRLPAPPEPAFEPDLARPGPRLFDGEAAEGVAEAA